MGSGRRLEHGRQLWRRQAVSMPSGTRINEARSWCEWMNCWDRSRHGGMVMRLARSDPAVPRRPGSTSHDSGKPIHRSTWAACDRTAPPRRSARSTSSTARGFAIGRRLSASRGGHTASSGNWPTSARRSTSVACCSRAAVASASQWEQKNCRRCLRPAASRSLRPICRRMTSGIASGRRRANGSATSLR